MIDLLLGCVIEWDTLIEKKKLDFYIKFFLLHIFMDQVNSVRFF